MPTKLKHIYVGSRQNIAQRLYLEALKHAMILVFEVANLQLHGCLECRPSFGL